MGFPSNAPITAFRITDRRYPPFDGGAFKWGSRWCNPGRYVVHATSSYALAVLENLVHFNIGDIPPPVRFSWNWSFQRAFPVKYSKRPTCQDGIHPTRTVSVKCMATIGMTLSEVLS